MTLHAAQHTHFIVNGEKDILFQVLVKSAQGGDADAFGDIVRATQAGVRGYLRTQMRDWTSADDLAQDVFVTAFLKIRDFRGESTMETWLRGIARNHLRNFLRKHREEAVGDSRELQVLLDQSCDHWNSEGMVDGRLQALRECLAHLPEQATTLLKERYVKDQNMREIAKESGKGYSALAMQFHRIREVLADCIERKLQLGES